MTNNCTATMSSCANYVCSDDDEQPTAVKLDTTEPVIRMMRPTEDTRSHDSGPLSHRYVDPKMSTKKVYRWCLLDKMAWEPSDNPWPNIEVLYEADWKTNEIPKNARIQWKRLLLVNKKYMPWRLIAATINYTTLRAKQCNIETLISELLQYTSCCQC